MRVSLFKALVPVTSLVLVSTAALAPAEACLWNLFGCCQPCARPCYAGRVISPYAVGYGAPVYWEGTGCCSGGCGINSGCSTCGVAASPGCSTCGDTIYGSGDCQVTPAQPAPAGNSGKAADPSDNWRKRTYDNNDAPLGGSRPESGAAGKDDAIRSRAGSGAAGGGATEGANPGPSGTPDDGEDLSRTTLRQPGANAAAESESSSADDDSIRVRIEPRDNSSGRSSKSPKADLGDEAESVERDGGTGKLGLPQASRLDHVVADRAPPVRERISAKKRTGSAQLVRVASYPKTPWSAEAEPKAVARNR